MDKHGLTVFRPFKNDIIDHWITILARHQNKSDNISNISIYIYIYIYICKTISYREWKLESSPEVEFINTYPHSPQKQVRITINMLGVKLRLRVPRKKMIAFGSH